MKTGWDDLLHLLQASATSEGAQRYLAPWIADEAFGMGHLYHDLGFERRSQLSAFMEVHFTSLAHQKPKSTLWKKFLFDSIGSVAPACALCEDSMTCFRCRDDAVPVRTMPDQTPL